MLTGNYRGRAYFKLCSHWTNSLTLVNVISRFRGSSINKHRVSGGQINIWAEWEDKMSGRFKCIKMSFTDIFITFQENTFYARI